MKARGIPHLIIASVAAVGLAACGPDMVDRASNARPGGSADNSKLASNDKGIPADTKSGPGADNTTMAQKSDALPSRDTSGMPSNVADDATIISSIKTALEKDPDLKPLKIEVQAKEGTVTLKGTAPNEATADRAAQLAMTVPGVKQVTNQVAPRKG